VRGTKAFALLLACVVGGVTVGTAAATGHKPKHKPKPKAKAVVKFDKRYDCAKIAPASLVTTLAGGFGGTYTLKLSTKIDNVVNNGAKGTGGYSHCDYAQSAGYPSGAKAEGPGEVTVLYGTTAIDFYKRDHSAAVQGVKCTGLKAANPNAVVDPRQCGPVPVAGIGNQAYEAGSYIAVLRGKTFIAVSLAGVPDANGQPTLVPADLLESIATALLARVPAM
jgi:hypothetical protein